MHKSSRIYVAGHTGLVGSCILRKLQENSYGNILTRTHGNLDLTNQLKTAAFFEEEKPDVVILAAAKVGGIVANSTLPVDFISLNLAIQQNVIMSALNTGVEDLLFLGSSCIYPRDCPQPIKEEYLLTGPLEETNRAYAVAKIAGLEMCMSCNRQYNTRYLGVMPANIYGRGDNYSSQHSHVLPGLMRRIHEAKKAKSPEVVVWGSGNPIREFLFSDDLAAGCVFLINNMEKILQLSTDKELPPICNIGSGEEVSIRKLARMLCHVVGYQGKLAFDESKPDGTPRKLLDDSLMLQMGWAANISLEEGLSLAYADYVENHANEC